MKLPIRSAALFLVLAAISAASKAYEYQIVGEARDMSSGELLYSEGHECDATGLFCSVSYLGEDGELFALKQLDYTVDPLAPSLKLEDFRLSREIELSGAADSVVDAGFDNFIRANWEQLAAGKKVRFPFLVPGRDEPLPMVAKKVDGDCLANEMCIEVKLNSWLLAILTDPILLTYEKETRRLFRYQGISNLRGPSGESQMVDIRYRYSDPEYSLTN